MFQSWRRKIRMAEVAFRHGRLDEAGKMLREEALGEYLPGRKLADEVAGAMAERARDEAVGGHTSAGWRNLDAAVALGGANQAAAEAREALVARSLAQAERQLAAGEVREAIERLEKVARRGSASHDQQTLLQVARRMEEAEKAAQQGDFAQADALLARAETLRPDLVWFQDLRERCRLKGEKARRANDQLHRALAAEQWSQVLEAAEALLAIAPGHSEARQAQRRAWAAVGIRATRRHRGLPRKWTSDTTNRRTASPQVDTVASRIPRERFLMWIDAVGGFLVCLGEEIVLGPPSSEAGADVPILADLSRRHAVIRRDGEGYLIESTRSVKIDGRPLIGIAPLADGNVIELGQGVELRFRRPHALSATARLEFVSRHKTQPSADAVLLMAESCVLGPSWHNHVVCRDWEDDVILFRQDGELHCRSASPFEIDGRACDGHGQVGRPAQIEGEDFTLSLEAV